MSERSKREDFQTGGDSAPDDAKVYRSQNAKIFDLALLPSPEPQFDLGVLLTKGKPSDGNPSSGFESLASCVAEDNHRAHVLRQSPRWAVRCSDSYVFHLDEMLNCCSQDDDWWWTSLTRASATAMRELRCRFLGATLKFVSDQPGIKPALITASHPGWCFGLDDYWDERLFPAPRDFRSILRIGGVMTAPGYLIAYLHTQFDPKIRRFVLQFRGVCGGEKLRCFLDLPQTLAARHHLPPLIDHLDPRITEQPSISVGVHAIDDLPRQITAMMPSTATRLAKPGGGSQKLRPVPEPRSTVQRCAGRTVEALASAPSNLDAYRLTLKH